MLQYSTFLAQSHSLVSLVGGQRILFIHHWDEYPDRCLQLHCIFSLPNPSLPRSSFLCHLTERLVSFSLRVFAQMWAARTLWHAWGLPMRLDGDSDTTARPNDLQNRRRRIEKAYSQPYTWVTKALFALLSCCSAPVFVFWWNQWYGCFK